ncbi:MAG: ribonucleotide-diphosphate reductase subunit beta [Actinomycetota bacterium]|nr:ribonucleotide-diphosphate reductase subunit beta [Actinomycetota bacterium]
MSVAQHDGIKTADSISYEDLYQRWEQSNWSATAIDLSEDREGWQALTGIQQRSAMWIYSMFLYGEDSVADNLSPYIDAAPKEEQKYFLATQQVDEARHAVFFHRFFKEVIGAGESIQDTLAATRPQLSWGYRHVFGFLDRMADELRRDRSLPKFAQAIALYHLVVEATLAQPGQHFIEDYFAKAGTLPGFTEGMGNISRDEQRHIGFGVKVLAELFDESDECREAVRELLLDVLPYSMAVFTPPGFDREYTRCYGFEMEDIFEFGFRSVRTKWRAIGWPLEEMPGVLPIDPELGPAEVARRQIALLEAGIIGQPHPNPQSSPELQRLFFDLVARSADTSAINGSPLTVQWRFADADPWHVIVANGSTRAEPGVAPHADITWETTWADWIGISKNILDPRRALLTRRLRFRGSPRSLPTFIRAFPRRRARSLR